MWLLTRRGFYSVVADRDDAENVLVRARARVDLEALRDVLGDLEIQETPDGDYRWRASVRRVAWSTALVLLAAEIDYPNFKAEVERRQGVRACSPVPRGLGNAPDAAAPMTPLRISCRPRSARRTRARGRRRRAARRRSRQAPRR